VQVQQIDGPSTPARDGQARFSCPPTICSRSCVEGTFSEHSSGPDGRPGLGRIRSRQLLLGRRSRSLAESVSPCRSRVRVRHICVTGHPDTDVTKVDHGAAEPSTPQAIGTKLRTVTRPGSPSRNVHSAHAEKNRCARVYVSLCRRSRRPQFSPMDKDTFGRTEPAREFDQQLAADRPVLVQKGQEVRAI
jgi:hypothetical protein